MKTLTGNQKLAVALTWADTNGFKFIGIFDENIIYAKGNMRLNLYRYHSYNDTSVKFEIKGIDEHFFVMVQASTKKQYKENIDKTYLEASRGIK